MTHEEAGPRISMLIVEDDQVAGDLIARMLAMVFPDAAIYRAADGVSGKELFKEHLPPIVITDVSMPRKDGIEMAREMKSLRPETKIIVLTAYSDAAFLEQFKEIGFHAYLYKPLDLEKLLAALEGCLVEEY